MKQYVLLMLIILTQVPPDWTRSARIADVDFWPDFTEEDMREGIDEAHEQGVSVVIAWVTSENIDIPQKDLDALKRASSYMHETYPDMRIIVYQAPLEIITENADTNRDNALDRGAKSISSEHPEWLQVGLDGRRAVFYGDFEFWIGKYDEDVWCCPNDPIYREKIKESVRNLAGTGIDGIWFDVVRFLCNFGDWDDNWACHCEDCQRKFEEETGLTLPEEVTWDSTWKTWISWRYHCIEDYIDELSQTAKEVNPHVQIIVEHWHGFDAEATENAWSPLDLQRVTDVLAHEYVSASEYLETYTPQNYLRDLGFYTFYRGSDKTHPSWLLVYSQREDGQKMLAASVLEAGCNFYDTLYPAMSDSVSIEGRTRIFQWLKENSDYYYGVEPVSNTALFYSKATIDFYDCPNEDWEFYREFVGVSMMLLSSHIPYTVITDLEDVERFDVVLLPHVVCLSDHEVEILNEFVKNGGYVVATGDTGYCDEWGDERSDRELEGVGFSVTGRLFGNEYYEDVNPFFYPDEAGPQGTGDEIREEFLEFLGEAPLMEIEMNTQNVVVLPFISDKLIFRVLNLEGITPGDAVPEPQTISIPVKRKVLSAFIIPFLGKREYVEDITFQVQDHCLLVVEVEPVSIFCNEYDLPAAERLASFLRMRGVPVTFVDSPEGATSVLIVFGGHKAQKTGEFVSSLLTDEQKNELEQLKFNSLYIFQKDQLILVIAGNEREDTARLTEEARREIFRLV